jgi:hypothetical protein
LMNAAALNAPIFIAAFVDACFDIGQQGLAVPSLTEINHMLAWSNAYYFIEDDTLKRGLWIPSESNGSAENLESQDEDRVASEMRWLPSQSSEQALEPSIPPVSPPSGPWAQGTWAARPETKARLKVFLCHSSGDKKAVRSLYRRLRADDFQPWLDEEDLLPGQDWEIEIPKAVRDSDIVVVCLSKGSVTKTGYVQKEIKFALDAADERPEGTVYIIPVLLEECAVPERLSKWHWVALYRYGGYKRLVASLKKRAADYK